ncbi:unnamed protein product [Darwinula stevensoni]|uniref:C2H2-type domain-containing protein n=1 Tax=Darwinula stevensoni TaxID=69355 RepID=A0A7R8ZZW4_9CRUS|nr:unnamed protein product [Darwinula stevensoni]CAG0883362.1 unnamed protein product [Darwinula stevensoni]
MIRASIDGFAHAGRPAWEKHSVPRCLSEPRLTPEEKRFPRVGLYRMAPRTISVNSTKLIRMGSQRSLRIQVSPDFATSRFSPEDKYSQQRMSIKKRFGLLLTQQPPPVPVYGGEVEYILPSPADPVLDGMQEIEGKRQLLDESDDSGNDEEEDDASQQSLPEELVCFVDIPQDEDGLPMKTLESNDHGPEDCSTLMTKVKVECTENDSDVPIGSHDCSGSDMAKNLKKRRRERPFGCDTCGCRFSSRDTLDHHITSRHLSEIKCQVCDKTFACRRNLNRHSFCHSNTEPHSCNVCGRTFMWKQSLGRHMTLAHWQGKHSAEISIGESENSAEEQVPVDPERTSQEDFVSSATGNSSSITEVIGDSVHFSDEHTDSTEPIHGSPYHKPIDEAGKGMSMRGTLTDHVNSKHSDARPFKCDICGCAFKRRGTLADHINSRHTEDRPFKCHICGWAFKWRRHLADHINSKHSEDRPLKCEICGCSFKWRCNLARHVSLRHVEDRPFKCDICGCSFKLRGILTKHVNTRHSEDRPFKCPLCDKTFKLKCTLTSHLQCHSDTKPYKCNMCDYSGKRKRGLKYHMTSVHPNEKMGCSSGLWLNCVVFIQSTNLERCLIFWIHSITEALVDTIAWLTAVTEMNEGITEASISPEDFEDELQFNHGSHDLELIDASGKEESKEEEKQHIPNTSSSLTAHVKSKHSEGRPFSCGICRCAFKRQGNLSDHIVMKHSEERPFKCPHCDMSFKWKFSLTDGGETEYILPNPVCSVLKEFQEENKAISAEYDEVQQSMSAVVQDCLPEMLESCKHGQENCSTSVTSVKMECTETDITATYELCLGSHELTNCNPDKNQRMIKRKRQRPFRCDTCGSTFTSEDTFDHHVISKHSKVFMCHICEKTFPCERNLEKHIHNHSIVKPHSCSLCGCTYKLKRSLERHMTAAHQQGRPDCLQENWPEVMRNDMNNSFKRKYPTISNGHHLEDNNFATTRIQAPDIMGATGDHKDNSGERITQVADGFSGLRPIHEAEKDKIVNQRKSSTVQNERPFRCDICGCAFKQRGTLTDHINSRHSEERPFQCDICGCAFKQRGTLSHHIKSRHSEDRPYKCHICGHAFKKRSNLTVHKMITDEHFRQHSLPAAMLVDDLQASVVKVEFIGTSDEYSQALSLEPTEDRACYEAEKSDSGALKPYQAIFTCDQLKQSLEGRDDVTAREKAYRCHLCDLGFSRQCSLKRHLSSCPSSNRKSCYHQKLLLKKSTEFARPGYINKDQGSPSTTLKSPEHGLQDCQIPTIQIDHPRLSEVKVEFAGITEEHEDPLHLESPNDSANETMKDTNKGRNSGVFHLTGSPFVCNICGFGFEVKVLMKYHMRQRHSDKRLYDHSKKPYRCDLCNESFSRQCALDRHTSCFHSKRKPDGSQNSLPKGRAVFSGHELGDFVKEDRVTAAAESESLIHIAVAADCHKTDSEQTHRLSHESLGKENRIKETTKMPTTVRNKTPLKWPIRRIRPKKRCRRTDHISRHSEDGYFKCDICGVEYILPTPVLDCLQYFPGETEMILHDDVAQQSLSEALEEASCPVRVLESCGSAIGCPPIEKVKVEFTQTDIDAPSESNPKSLELGGGDAITNVRKGRRKRARPFICETCGSTFSSKDMFDLHVQSRHLTEFKCHLCRKTFTRERNLKRHALCHSNMERFTCDVCGRSFNWKEGLSQHMTMFHSQVKLDQSQEDGSHCTKDDSLDPSNSEPHAHNAGDKPRERKSERQKDEGRKPAAPHLSERPFIDLCDICGCGFRSRDSLKSHIRAKHSNERPFRCDVCGHSFKHSHVLKDHVRLKHSDERPFKCDLCDKTFKVKQILARHRHSHTTNACHLCSSTFKTKQSLDEHMGHVHSDENQGVESEKKGSEEHHLEDRNFGCSICGSWFKKKHALKEHIRYRHSDDRPFKCDSCEKAFKGKQDLIRHQSVHSNTCHLCSSSFDTKLSLDEHMTCAHSSEKCEEESEETALREHSPDSGVREEDSLLKSSCLQDCPSAAAVLNHPTLLEVKVEISESDIANAVNAMNCESPEKRVKDEGNSVMRRKKKPDTSHSAERPFACSICGSGFKTRRTLSKHIRVGHSERRPYRCDLCGCTFKQSHNLKYHIQYRHSDERPFKCDLCGMAFKMRPKLRRHRRGHATTTCNLCNFTFKTKQRYLGHMAHVHSSGNHEEGSLKAVSEESTDLRSHCSNMKNPTNQVAQLLELVFSLQSNNFSLDSDTHERHLSHEDRSKMKVGGVVRDLCKVGHRHLAIRSSRCLSTWSPVASAFNARPLSKLNLSLLREDTGLFGVPELKSPEGFYLLKERAITRSEDLVQEALNPHRTRKIVEIFDDLSDCLCQVADLAEFIRVAHPQSKFTRAAENASIGISALVERLNTNRKLYDALKHVLVNGDHVPTDDIDDRVAHLFAFDFEQCGIHLGEGKREQVAKLNDYILLLGQRFTAGTTHPRLVPAADIPKDVPHPRMKLEGSMYVFRFPRDGDNYVVTGLHADASTESVRELSYRLFLKPDAEQESLLEELLLARHQMASFCGFPSYSHRVLRWSLARSPEFVGEFLESLSEKLAPRAQVDLKHMEWVKRNQQPDAKPLAMWDPPFYTAQVRNDKYRIHPGKVSAYLSVGACMHGLDVLLNALYGVHLVIEEPLPGELWAPDVHKIAGMAMGLCRHILAGLARQAKVTAVYGRATEKSLDANLEKKVGTKKLERRAQKEAGELGRDMGQERRERGECEEVRGVLVTALANVCGRPPPETANPSPTVVICGRTVRHEEEGVLGYIYCDFYDRPGKPNQDCHFTIRGGRRLPDGTYQVKMDHVDTVRDAFARIAVQLPIVVLMLTVPPGQWGKPPLLLPGMVENLFHEMGHALHSLLARTRYQHVTGTRTSTDFAEVPSTLMEHFAFDPRVLGTFARHFDSGQAMPEELVMNLCASKQVFAASEAQLQVFYSALDLCLHGAHPLPAPTAKVLEDTHNRYYGLGYVPDTDDPFSRSGGEGVRWGLLAHGGGRDPRDLVASTLGREVTPLTLTDSLVAELDERASHLRLAS